KWVIDRCVGRAAALETAIGYVPRLADLDLRGIDASTDAIEDALAVDKAEWEKELDQHGDWFDRIGTVPEALRLQRRLLLSSLRALDWHRRAYRRGVPGPFDRFNDRAKRVLALAQDERSEERRVGKGGT